MMTQSREGRMKTAKTRQETIVLKPLLRPENHRMSPGRSRENDWMLGTRRDCTAFLRSVQQNLPERHFF
jgi:hypothetical protein